MPTFCKEIAVRKMASLLILISALYIPRSSLAQTQLLQSFGPSITVQSANGSFIGISGDTGQVPGWVSQQWGIPTDLQPTVGSASGWDISNEYARIKFYNQFGGFNNVYELAQSGTECGKERDLLLSASSVQTPPGAQAGMQQSSPISQIGSLSTTVTLFVPYVAMPAGGCSSNVQYSQYVFSFVLKSNLGQTLFYQVQIGRNTVPDQNPSVSWCPEYEFSNNQDFCLDDDVRNSDGYFIVYPGSGVTTFDIIPRFRQIISEGHQKAGFPSVALDANAGNWYVESIYIGEIVQGHTNDTTQWANAGLASYPGGAFCSGSSAIQYTCGSGQPPGSGWVDVGNTCYHRNTGKSCF